MPEAKHIGLTVVLIAAAGCAAFARAARVEPAVPLKAHSFSLAEVKLLEGPFRHALDLNVEALLRYEPDKLLARYRSEAGLKPRAEHYGGWESKTIAGHSLGHYLSACALTYAATGDERFLQRVNYIVDELDACQQADGSGYIGGIPDGKKILEEQVAKGQIRSKGFDLNGIWVPFYTQHKLLAGLRDAYRICGKTKALQIAQGLGDWLGKLVADLSDEQMQQILHCEHGGINEVLADLYTDTAQQRYLDLSRRFHHTAVLDPLADGVDCLPGLHANTQIPKLVGLAARYELTGDRRDKAAAAFFWDRVVHHHSYVTGGHCFNEHFAEPDKLNDRLGPSTTETCNVYNMLKLTRHLFQWNATAEVADFYERALLNHIFSSQHPEDGRVIYNLSMEMGGFKQYQDPYWFSCCVGTGMENHSKYGECIYFHGDDSLYVNLMIASELNWKQKGLVLRQETGFPKSDTTSLRFNCQKPVRLALKIRYPYWAQKGLAVSVNGQKEPVEGKPSSYITLDRTWKTGDVVNVTIPKTLRLETMPDNPNRVAVMYGPLVLAGDLGAVETADADTPTFVPALVTEARSPSEWLRPVDGQANTFQMIDVGRPRNVTLRPFYATHQRRYTIFWDVFTEDQWAQRQAQYEAERKRRQQLEAITIDFVQPGEMQPERDHNMQGERTGAGTHNGRAWRHAPGGWFAFDMKVLGEKPITLRATYWGDDVGRTFDVLVDGQKVATQILNRDAPGKFFDVDYPLLAEQLTSGKQKVTVRFQAKDNSTAGGLFGLRVLRTSDTGK